jgi:3'-phosphoadenosine 5'-phosphosulfate sulfotransferase (PAPS reductase)/FAD synthetase
MKDKNIMVAVSGGRSSARMARHIQTSEKYKDYNKVYVFANTGQERPETIQFLKDMVKHWSLPLVIIEGVYSSELGVGVRHKVVDFDTMSMDSKPFEEMIMHKNKGVFSGMPSKDAPFCSENLKTLPCKKLCDEIFGVNNYIKAIGFRVEDMPKRITFAEIKEDQERIFPLLTDFRRPVSQSDLNHFFNKEGFKLEIHGKLGNCELCWKKSDQNLLDNIRYGARTIEWWKKMEYKYGNTSFRGNKSIDDLVRMASMPFTPEIEFPKEEEDDSCVCSF